MKLSVCCIAKNEESAIRFMLDSVKDVADEIIVVDTGSTDRTVEVAKEYTDKVLFHEWDNSFANARNVYMEAATGDWILQLDCDETLAPETAAILSKFLEKVDASVQLVMPTMVMCKDDGTQYQHFLAERIYRPHLRFCGDMHNYLDVPAGPERLTAPQLAILHDRSVRSSEGRVERSLQRLAMAESIFLKRVEENPKDRRSLFYLAGTYFDSQMYDKAKEWFPKYLEVSDWGEERYQARLLLAQCHKMDGDLDSARKVLVSAMNDDWRRAEAYVLLGELSFDAGDIEQAEWWFKAATLKPYRPSPLFVEPAAHSWQPHLGLYHCYSRMGKNQLAVKHGDMAMELGAPQAGHIAKFKKNNSMYGSQKIACLVDRGQMDFIQPLIDYWTANGVEVAVTSREEDIDEAVGWADIIWCEWAGPLANALTHRTFEKKPRIIVRVHGYEVHSGMLPQVNWNAVDNVIFVARYLEELAMEQVPGLAETCNVHVVPGGVETAKFSIGENKTGNKIAMLGYCNARKNIPLALQILAKCPDKELHIAGEWQDGELYQYVAHVIEELGLQDRVFIHGRASNANEFFSDKDFILSTGVRETFHYALAEGMAAGLKPVIHCWKSGDDFYKQDWIFRTVDEAVGMLAMPGDSQEYREYAERHLDVETNIKRINRIIKTPGVSVVGEPKYVHAAEYQTALALERLGCSTDRPEPEVVILMGHAPRVEPWMGCKKKILWHEELIVGDSEKAVQSRALISPVVPEVDVVVTLQADCAQVFRDMGAKRVEVLPWVGAHPPWRKLNIDKDIEIGFYGSITPRRKAVLDELAESFAIGICEEFDHVKLNEFVNRCKVVLNINAYDVPLCPIRIGECMAAGACVVSEPLPEAHPFPCNAFVETSDLKDALTAILQDDTAREATARNGHKWIWSHCTLEQQLERICGYAEI